jgi:hypothetical protein
MCETNLAHAQVVRSMQNPLQIATLHWYQANLTANFQVAMSGAMTFDGANIWVANSGSFSVPGNSVTKLRPSDGAVLGIFTVGSGPIGMAFDGANIWVANFQSNSVTKLRATDRATLGTFTVSSPQGVVFDGANIWVTNFGSASVPSNTVTELRATDGATLGTFDLGATALAFDGFISGWQRSVALAPM